MIQMASIFGEQERQIIRSRVLAGLDRVRQQGKKLGRPKVSPKIANAIREHLSAGHGILKVATIVGVGSGTVQRVKREMAGEFVRSHKVMDRYSKPPNLHQSNRTLKCRGHSIGRMTGTVPFVAASTVRVSA